MNAAADKVLKDIVSDLESVLNKCGIMYHIFSRAKSEMSTKCKLEKKAETYKIEGKKMQDFLALRITLYFTDDVELVYKYLKTQPNFVDETVDKAEEDKFCPKRLNLVMRVSDTHKADMAVARKNTGYSDLIDDTYEIQIRTILSEGWHEVEHDLRYKCKEDWTNHSEESRLLNGIYASLESSEWSMLTLFDKLAYVQYKEGAWSAMMRNKMRLRFADKGLSQEIIELLSRDHDLAKRLFRAKRSKILKTIMEKKFSFPLTYDTVLHLLNHIDVKNKELADLEEHILKEDMDILFGTIE
jgi:ppGpp synthetase/RelA/SpoT-type nucleotidyltranferase